MTNAKHTPGPWVGIDPKTKKFRNSPWTVDNETASCTVAAPIKAKRKTVALVVTDDWYAKDELHANAHLIAAAPELLEALKDMLHVMEQHEQLSGCDCSIGDQARAAIAKATGGSL